MRNFGTEAFRKNEALVNDMELSKSTLKALKRVINGRNEKRYSPPPYWGPDAPRGSLEIPPYVPSLQKPVVTPERRQENRPAEQLATVTDLQQRRQEKLDGELVEAQKALFKRPSVAEVAVADQVATQPVEIVEASSSAS